MQYFNVALEKLFTGAFDIDSLDIRAALAMADGSNDPATEIDATTLSAFWSAAGFSTAEFDGTGYSRTTLTGNADTRDDSADLVKLTSDDFTLTSLSAGTHAVSGALIYAHESAGDSASWPISWLPYAANQSPDGTDFPVNFHADGWLKISQAAGSTSVRFYNVFKEKLANGGINLASDDIRAVLSRDDGPNDSMTETDADTLSAFFSSSGVSTVEFNGANYARATLANKAASAEHNNDLARMTADDLTFSSLGAGSYAINGILIYRHVSSDSDSWPICYRKFSPTRTPSGTDFAVNWGTNGVLRIAKG